MKRKRNVIILIIVIMIFIISLMNNSYSKFISSGSVSGTTTIPAKIFDVDVTYKYVYIDELLNEVEFKPRVTEVRQSGDIITLVEEQQSFQYDEFHFYVNGGEYTQSTYTLTGDTTIEYVYYLTRYNIVYNLAGGTLDNPIGQYTINTATFDLPTPTNGNMLFTGWSSTRDIEGEPLIMDSTLLEIGETYVLGTQNGSTISLRTSSGKVYATYAEYNDGYRCVVFVEDPNAVVQYNNSNNTNWITISNWQTAGEFENQYFTFGVGGREEDNGISTYDGTYTEFIDELSQIVINVPATNPYTITKGSSGNIEVTAVWHERQTFTVTLYRNNRTNDNTTRTQTFTEGIAQNLMANPFTRNGYTFSGWATSRNGSVVYTDQQEITVTGNMPLYAVWTR